MLADSVDTYAGETYWSDHRFSISVYKLDSSYCGSGYLQVLQYVSAGPYPAERDGAHYVIERELSRVRSRHDLPGRTTVVTDIALTVEGISPIATSVRHRHRAIA